MTFLILALTAGCFAGAYYLVRKSGGLPLWAWGALTTLGLLGLVLRRLDLALLAAGLAAVAYLARRPAGEGGTVHLIEFFRGPGGHLDGRILAGQFEGSFLSDLSSAEKEVLMGEMHELHLPTFDQLADWLSENGGNAKPPVRSTGMSRKEALDVLGLSEGASNGEILSAYKDLMRKLHPDQGGTSYLAQKINNAKEVLINKEL